MSRDPPDALARFSTEECAGKFPIASADLNIVTGFDVNDNANFTTRTTYVIGLNGDIALVHDDDGYNGQARGSPRALVHGL